MKVLRVAQMSMRALGVLALILGFMVWPGNQAVTGIHMLVGLLLVLAALVLGGVVVQRSAARPIGAVLIVLALVLTWLGLNQAALMPGDAHWVIRLLHLLLGVLVIGLGEMAAARGTRAAVGAA